MRAYKIWRLVGARKLYTASIGHFWHVSERLREIHCVLVLCSSVAILLCVLQLTPWLCGPDDVLKVPHASFFTPEYICLHVLMACGGTQTQVPTVLTPKRVCTHRSSYEGGGFSPLTVPGSIPLAAPTLHLYCPQQTTMRNWLQVSRKAAMAYSVDSLC